MTRDEACIGTVGVLTVATRGDAGPGEVLIKIRGGTEAFLAWSEKPLPRGATVLVIESRGARAVAGARGKRLTYETTGRRGPAQAGSAAFAACTASFIAAPSSDFAVQIINISVGALAGLTARGQFSAVGPGQLGRDGQPDTAAGDLLGSVPAPEAVEDVRQVLGRDADAGVADLQHRVRATLAGADVQATP